MLSYNKLFFLPRRHQESRYIIDVKKLKIWKLITNYCNIRFSLYNNLSFITQFWSPPVLEVNIWLSSCVWLRFGGCSFLSGKKKVSASWDEKQGFFRDLVLILCLHFLRLQLHRSRTCNRNNPRLVSLCLRSIIYNLRVGLLNVQMHKTQWHVFLTWLNI